MKSHAKSPSPPRAQRVTGEGRGEGVAHLLLRKSPTDAEKIMWQAMRNRQVAGLKFRRQYPVDHYIPDFVCFDPKVIIEIDGGQHADSRTDKRRDEYLISQGFRIFRFWNNDVLANLEGVLEFIGAELIKAVPGPTTPLTPTLSRPLRGGRGRQRSES
jgi:very-short-patch-repair endonuclease